MALHPDDRPPDVAAFRQALQSGNGLSLSEDGQTIVVQPTIHLPTLSSPADRYLVMAALLLLLLAGIFTLVPIPLP
jgi:hypothetical protein